MATRSLYSIVEDLAGVTEENLALQGRLCFEEIPLPTWLVPERPMATIKTRPGESSLGSKPPFYIFAILDSNTLVWWRTRTPQLICGYKGCPPLKRA